MADISRESPVVDRILHLKALLLKWEEDGIPAGVVVPKSASQVKSWQLEEYCVFPIGSKRDWRTTHEIWGHVIVEIGAIIKRLATKKPNHHPFEPERMRRLRTQSLLAETEATLHKVTAQWHAAREQAEIAEVRRAYLQTKLELADAEKAALIAENAELVRSMSPETRKLKAIK